MEKVKKAKKGCKRCGVEPGNVKALEDRLLLKDKNGRFLKVDKLCRVHVVVDEYEERWQKLEAKQEVERQKLEAKQKAERQRLMSSFKKRTRPLTGNFARKARNESDQSKRKSR